jgi:hypothetical protein
MENQERSVGHNCFTLQVGSFTCYYDNSGAYVLRVRCVYGSKRVKLSWGD